MRVRPVDPLGPAFEISFGQFADGKFSIEASTISELTGTCTELSMSRVSEGVADVGMDSETTPWGILEWEEP
jgi:hypothetical protein